MPRQYVLKSKGTAPSGIDYAAELNEQQLEAVTAPPGPMLVIAGAGSGKTRTLTYRVAYLLENGFRPDELLLLTFTNKASKEMLGRVEHLLPNSTAGLWGGTFHSIGNRILRRHADVIGFRRGFSIMDRSDQKDLLEAVITETRPARPGGKAAEDFPKSTVIADIFSYAVNTGQGIQEVVETRHPQHAIFTEAFDKIFQAYEARKLQANVMDFDDLLAKALDLLKNHESIAAGYQQRFRGVLVDEYQDTNRIQSEFIDVLAKKHRNIMVVGDDAQAIYSWRGAKVQNILNFPQVYAGARLVRIETNYRSRPAILELANEAIALNQRQFPKVLRPARENDEVLPALVPLRDNHQQAQFIVERIQDLIGNEGVPAAEIAVLYRAHFHSMELEMELIRAQIPYTLTSGLRFFEQAHIKDIIAFLKFLNNPTDEVSFMRMALLGDGIGKRGAYTFWTELMRDLPAVGSYPRWGEVFAKIKTGAKAAKAWDNLAEALDMAQGTEGKPLMPSDQLAMVLNCFYERYAHQKYPDAHSRLEDITQLIRYASSYEDLETFLAELALLGNTDDQPDQDRNSAYQEGGSITLSSVHQAKGLEWRHVFVIWLAENSFPSYRSVETADGLEEERRLFYVAITRAKDALYLTYPRMRLGKGGSYGYGGDAFQTPSRFIDEVSPRLLEEWEVSSGW
jgi:DNA helicase-2/ATP-dependent DNA helicase PcrA